MLQQSITLFQVIEFFGVVLAIVFTGMGISRQIKKNYNDYVDSKMKVMETRVSSIEQNIINNEAQNRREHDRLTKLFDKIDEKLDQLIDKFV